MNKIPIVAYCRVSTDSKDQENSFENQKTYFKKEISDQDEYELVKIYADKGLSATSFNKRKAFLEMVYDAGVDYEIKNGNVNFTASKRESLFKRILVTNLSRFSRDIVVKGCIRELKKKEVYVDFLSEGKSTENISDELLVDMLFLFAQQESRDKSSKVLFGHERGAKKGTLTGTTSLYGYIYHSDTNSLEIIEDEAEVVRKIFTWYSEGIGIRRIIKLLDQDGIKTRKEKSFEKTTISKMLENEKYCGDLFRNKYDNGTVFYRNTYAKLKPEDQWEKHFNHERVPSIITRELFQKCQKIKSGRSENHRGVNRGHSKYAGLIKCGKCGSSYVRNCDRGRYFYNCSGKKIKGIDFCSSKNVYEDFLEKQLKLEANGLFYGSFLLYKTSVIGYLGVLKSELMSKIDQDKNEEVEEKKAELNEKVKMKERLADLYIMGKFSQDYLNEKTIEIDNDINKVEVVIKELSLNNREIFQSIKEIDDQVEYLEALEIKQTYTEEEILENTHQIIVDSQFNKVDLYFENKAIDLIKRVSSKYKIEHKTEEGTFYLPL